MALYMGIDAGGSKTECAIARGEDIVSTFTAGSCKMQQVGREQAAKSLIAAVRGALLEANIDGANVRNCCVGISGISDPAVAEFVKATLRPLMPAEITAIGDHIIAHEAAFQGQSGVLVIAGTGSIAYGRNQRGEIARAGGQGPEVSDEGSGFWIGREAVAAITRGDLAQESPLAQLIMKRLHVKTKEELGAMLAKSPPPPFADLFPDVLTESKSGNLIAREILNRAGGELAKLALQVIAKLWPEPITTAKDSALRIAGSGGVLTNSEEVREALRQILLAQRPNAIYDQKPVHPVEGALYLARNAGATTGAMPRNEHA